MILRCLTCVRPVTWTIESRGSEGAEGQQPVILRYSRIWVNLASWSSNTGKIESRLVFPEGFLHEGTASSSAAAAAAQPDAGAEAHLGGIMTGPLREGLGR
jgi:hypothetical protein